MHEVTDLDDRQVGGQLTGLLVRAESDQLAPQLGEVAAAQRRMDNISQYVPIDAWTAPEES